MQFERRGIVEGFYGPPWSHADRLWWIERLGRWGMDFYAHAPKNDPLHRDRWREPWPDGTLREFAELLAAGARHGVTVCFTLSPGLSIHYASEEDARALEEKYRSLVSIGARAFGLLLDDVPAHLVHEDDRAKFASLGDAHVALAGRLREAFGPAVSWWLCPTDYLGIEPSPYLETLGAGLPADVAVAWTGRTVCSPSISAAEAAPRARALRRRLWLWDNVPVSDGPMRHLLHLGPYGRRDPDLVRHVSGVLLNPMQHAHASAVAVRTAAAYLADPAGYDPEAAWQEALSETGAGAGEAFALFAEAHRFSAIWPEDRDRPLEDAVRALRAALSADTPPGRAGGDGACDGEAAQGVRLALDRLAAALDARLAANATLPEQLADRALAAELEPWLVSHRRETQRMRWAVDALRALESAPNAAARARALFGLALRLGSDSDPQAVSYGPRRVLYPQLASMFEDAMRLGTDPALVRDRCLGDEVVRLAEDRALAWLAPRSAP